MSAVVSRPIATIDDQERMGILRQFRRFGEKVCSRIAIPRGNSADQAKKDDKHGTSSLVVSLNNVTGLVWEGEAPADHLHVCSSQEPRPPLMTYFTCNIRSSASLAFLATSSGTLISFITRPSTRFSNAQHK